MKNTCIIILAAGSSSRLGMPKQFLPFNNKTLLQHTVDEAWLSGAGKVLVVTGFEADTVSKAIEEQPVDIVFNRTWRDGMASGIVAGVGAAMISDSIDSIIIAVCDQPFISAEIFGKLYRTHIESQKPIVVSAYSDTVGTPALFSKQYFDELLSLKGTEGAKKIVKANSGAAGMVAFPMGYIDIDTKIDYEKLIAKK